VKRQFVPRVGTLKARSPNYSRHVLSGSVDLTVADRKTMERSKRTVADV